MLTRNTNETEERGNFIKQLSNPASAYSFNFLPIDKYQSNARHEIGLGTKGLVLHAQYTIGEQLNALVKHTLLKALAI